MSYLFTSESVSEGHPDKIADQISDAILDEFLAFDPNARVACETMVTTGLVMLCGEVKSKVYIDLDKVARKVIEKIGYTKSEYKFNAGSCAVLNYIHEQSSDINRGVDRESIEQQGAGDQGMMYGYATNETPTFMPLALHISHLIMKALAEVRKDKDFIDYLRPDAKAQVTIEYSDHHKPIRIHTIVISTQHDDFGEDSAMKEKISDDMRRIVIPKVKEELDLETRKLFDDEIIYHINPTGRFVEGGPHGDAGLTGRKIIVDTYGGKGAHGGGAFSGKDASKVDRSGAYAARHIAKNLVAAGVSDEILVQVAYAIGKAEPMSIYVNTYGKSHVELSDGEIVKKISTLFDLRPGMVIQNLKLNQPIFAETASYGHMGRKNETVTKSFSNNGREKTMQVELFTWEKLDMVEQVKEAFELI